MKKELVISSIDTIEKTLRNYTAYEISEVDKILEQEAFKIRKETENIFIIEKIFDITFHWKVFSGQKTRDGHKSHQP